MGFINESDIEDDLYDSDSSESDDEEYGILTNELKNKRKQWKRIDKQEHREWETNQVRLSNVLRLRKEFDNEDAADGDADDEDGKEQ